VENRINDDTIVEEFDRVLKFNTTLKHVYVSERRDKRFEIATKRNKKFRSSWRFKINTFVGHELGSFNFDIDVFV